MNQEEQKLTSIIEERLEAEYFLVELTFKNQKPKPKLTVLIDGDQGISIDKCAELSRWLGKQIEEQNIIPNAYTLEVSSPGTDTPLKSKRQYIKNIGRNVKVWLEDNQREVGKLEKVEDSLIVIQPEKKGKEIPPLMEIPFDQIQKTKVMVSFK
ncbi:hypothetical protein BKI52_32035 [marine bacterium AO1-C]|nr:hypothetical protein BKI52_32035 [marine bacterium AO1-C]